MERERYFATEKGTYKCDPWDGPEAGAAVEVGLAQDSEWPRPNWMQRTGPICLPDLAAQFTLEMNPAPKDDQPNQPSHSSPSLADFVENRFIPEYVAMKRSAGRSYFRAILNHVLTPERVARAFAVDSGKPTNKLKAVPDWPYMGSMHLCDISAEAIQRLTMTALRHGYSTQTAAHIRNVIRTIFSYAIQTGSYMGTNPATLVRPPAITHKEAHTLSLAQLKGAIRTMRYPEKEIALFEILTEIGVAELCGLQWKYLNISNLNRFVEGEFIPPKTIAVRKLSYRGEFGTVTPNRERFMRMPEVLCTILRDLKNRKQFTAPDDFVLVSRNGTPIHPENIVARRLKTIGESLGMPWLSLWVFHRTGINLRSEFGRRLPEEVEKILSHEESPIRQ